jgi:hypothetical protein
MKGRQRSGTPELNALGDSANVDLSRFDSMPPRKCTHICPKWATQLREERQNHQLATRVLKGLEAEVRYNLAALEPFIDIGDLSDTGALSKQSGQSRSVFDGLVRSCRSRRGPPKTRLLVTNPHELALPRDSRARLLPRHDVLEHLVEVPDDDELRRRRNPRSRRTLTSPGAQGCRAGTKVST